jgi:nucleosome binding factor SPN SPT16 subunit
MAITLDKLIENVKSIGNEPNIKYRRKIATIEVYENGIRLHVDNYSPNGIMLAYNMRKYGIDHWKEVAQTPLTECEKFIDAQVQSE